MQYVRYLRETKAYAKGQIVEQPEAIAYSLIDAGVAEFSYDPHTQAEIDALDAEAEADERGEEVGLAVLGSEEDVPKPRRRRKKIGTSRTEAKAAEDHDRKPPIDAEGVRRAILNNKYANKAALSDADVTAGAENEDRENEYGDSAD